jgi:hypothetical protein
MRQILFTAVIAAALSLSTALPGHSAFAGCPSYDPNCQQQPKP